VLLHEDIIDAKLSYWTVKWASYTEN